MKKAFTLIICLVFCFSTITSCNKKTNTLTKVGSLLGPTSIGLLNMIDKNDSQFQFEISSSPDEIAALLVAGNLDIALIPANLASVLYNKTNGNIVVLNINTLGVLYCISSDKSIDSITDLEGRTIVTTGQGATPEYALSYLIEENNISDVSIEFETEAASVITRLNDDPTLIGVLPQPQATQATLQNPSLNTAFSLNQEWERLDNGSAFVTGVTVVRREFLNENRDVVRRFLKEQEASINLVTDDLNRTAELAVSQGIIPALEISMEAIPYCNVTFVTGTPLKNILSGYLITLYDKNPQAVGGALPDDDFYYEG